MKTRSALIAMVSIFLLIAVGSAQTYQTGKIVSITKHATPSAPGHTDAPVRKSVDDYDVTISSGGTVYKAIYHHGNLEPAWSEGKEVQVQASGKVLQVKKANGKAEKLRILSSEPVGN